MRVRVLVNQKCDRIADTEIAVGIVMPSRTLLKWQSVRKLGLDEFDRQCLLASAASQSLILDEENLQAFVMLIGAHFQGHCRDLHSECAQALSKAYPQLGMMMQSLGVRRMLDRGNASTEVIRNDFIALGVDLDLAFSKTAQDAQAFKLMMTHIWYLNEWRNHCAHHNIKSPKKVDPLTMANIRVWASSCDLLAREIDRIMEQYLFAVTGVNPW